MRHSCGAVACEHEAGKRSKKEGKTPSGKTTEGKTRDEAPVIIKTIIHVACGRRRPEGMKRGAILHGKMNPASNLYGLDEFLGKL
jgi:hypothetical protein